MYPGPSPSLFEVLPLCLDCCSVSPSVGCCGLNIPLELVLASDSHVISSEGLYPDDWIQFRESFRGSVGYSLSGIKNDTKDDFTPLSLFGPLTSVMLCCSMKAPSRCWRPVFELLCLQNCESSKFLSINQPIWVVFHYSSRRQIKTNLQSSSARTVVHAFFSHEVFLDNPASSSCPTLTLHASSPPFPLLLLPPRIHCPTVEMTVCAF